MVGPLAAIEGLRIGVLCRGFGSCSSCSHAKRKLRQSLMGNGSHYVQLELSASAAKLPTLF